MRLHNPVVAQLKYLHSASFLSWSASKDIIGMDTKNHKKGLIGFNKLHVNVSIGRFWFREKFQSERGKWFVPI